MQDPRIHISDEGSDMQTWKELSTWERSRGKNFKVVEGTPQLTPSRTSIKAYKHWKKDASVSRQKSEIRHKSESLPTNSGDEYHVLRQKYMLLDEERFALVREVREVEDEIKTLEGDKLALLDQLVVLEGLVDPFESTYGPI